MVFWVAIPSLFLLLFSPPGSFQEEKKPHPGVDAFRVNLAIDKGARWIQTKKNFSEWDAPGDLDGKLRDHDLVLYTLFHAGVDPDKPYFQDLLSKVITSELETTYTVALQAMVLQEMDPVKYRWRIAQCAQFLVDNQCQNGQWPYGEKTKIPSDVPTFHKPAREEVQTAGKKKKKPGKPKRINIRAQRTGVAKGDNSNSQYAILGLRACMEANIWPSKEVLVKSLDWWKQAQQNDGGWAYHGAGSPSYGSMTAGAVGSVVILQHYLGRKWKRDIAARKGMQWITRSFSITENPGKTESWHYYYLYALERTGVLTGLGKFGRKDWYKEGANYLLDAQESEGSWKNLRNTCFAILFLKRATPPLKKVATGR